MYLDTDARWPDGFDEVYRLGESVMSRVASTETPQPILAIVERRLATLAPGTGWVVVADRIADPGNLGTIIRSAEAAGASRIVLTAGTVDAFNPKVIRASAGAVFHVGIVEDATLEDVREGGYRLIGTTSHGGLRAQDYRQVDLRGAIALVLGNEAHGLESTAPIDEWVTIPHSGRSESLNVAMAGTILSFAIATQHEAPTAGE